MTITSLLCYLCAHVKATLVVSVSQPKGGILVLEECKGDSGKCTRARARAYASADAVALAHGRCG